MANSFRSRSSIFRLALRFLSLALRVRAQIKASEIRRKSTETETSRSSGRRFTLYFLFPMLDTIRIKYNRKRFDDPRFCYETFLCDR